MTRTTTSRNQWMGLLAVTGWLLACAGPATNQNPDLAASKAELQKLRAQQGELADKIQKLEMDIASKDSSFGARPKLVNITELKAQDFAHYIDLQGKITTKEIYFLSPRGQGGQVKAVYVKEGDRVQKGDLILKLDDAVMLQNIQQMETQLSYARDLYNRQKNLWDQQIGTEVQLITAKNNVDNLEKQLSILKEQWNFSNVYSSVSGVVESVAIRVGEFFTGAPNATISIVNPGSLKAVVEVPENYLSSVRKGTPVLVEVPDAAKQFRTSINLVSQLINTNSRAFTAEALVPSDPVLKPNQLAVVRIQDYTASQVMVIPMTTLQTDENGKFVYVLILENGHAVARKRSVQVGAVYGEKIEIKTGLKPGDSLISEGYQGLYDGQSIATS